MTFFAKIICRVFYNANTIIKETIFKGKVKKHLSVTLLSPAHVFFGVTV